MRIRSMTLSGLLGTLFAGALQTVGVRGATEQPAYQIVDHVGAVEVRQYEGRIAAEVLVKGDEADARNDGFRKVAAYIFGDNVSRAEVAMTAPVVQKPASQAIAMTAPVTQKASADGWRIQFVMPAKYTMATLPKPKDGSVTLTPLPARRYAVIRFSGSRNPATMDRALATLKAGLAGSAWTAAGEPEDWFYDPPWTVPFLRRNEVALPVEAKG